MARLIFDSELSSSRRYECGVKNCVLYVTKTAGDGYTDGYVWNGITSISETFDSSITTLKADGVKYADIPSLPECGLTIECVTIPDRLRRSWGFSYPYSGGVYFSGQRITEFGLAYKSTISSYGNEEYGEVLHLWYNCMALPPERNYETLSEEGEPMAYSFDISSMPVESGIKRSAYANLYDPVAHVEIYRHLTSTDLWDWFDTQLFGSDTVSPNIPPVDDIYAILKGDLPISGSLGPDIGDLDG